MPALLGLHIYSASRLHIRNQLSDIDADISLFDSIGTCTAFCNLTVIIQLRTSRTQNQLIHQERGFSLSC